MSSPPPPPDSSTSSYSLSLSSSSSAAPPPPPSPSLPMILKDAVGAYFATTSGGWIMLNSSEASLPAKVKNCKLTTWMFTKETTNIDDIAVHHNPAVTLGCVLCNFRHIKATATTALCFLLLWRLCFLLPGCPCIH